MVSQYNTRRKSLSLPSLGIALPGRSVRSPPSDSQHIAKRQKRSHSGSSSSSPSSPPRLSALRFDDKSNAGRVPDSPPPSPGGEATKVDTQGIDDTIVVGVIEQLEKTGNRPHLLKELATVLSPTIPIVESSANPAAIISSRLATYLKRNWSALSRCPLDKKLVGTHPKRVYYFLTTSPHQPIPEDAGIIPSAARIISPSLSSAASDDNDADSHTRDVRSPSPELDLSDYDDAVSDPFTNATHQPTTHNIAHNRRAQSPPLEVDEREFTRTASSLQERRRSAQAERERSNSAVVENTTRLDVAMDMDGIPELVETEESAARKNSETAAALFGQMQHAAFDPVLAISSPLLKPALNIEMPPSVFKASDSWSEKDDDEWAMKSPENIELDELDDLFGNY
ncbi:hypothetical protein DPSP01_011195 [Paraphaeosphaeria sporulosa]|uniref:GDS1 winged helix domain-containing protein n=1 Tax=Paraphaeosphaeria sporulosa TaxID=1460663 RepID=A0A177CMC6_9PLEO|nr:uncharacterized protein CC84DRAFT_1203795 [Paraphaeosphaeria sporulosa]OAG08411.1 hypothetical protein CC84DRAFT_1203795 [Paraphaeosphaeria sporulosa]